MSRESQLWVVQFHLAPLFTTLWLHGGARWGRRERLERPPAHALGATDHGAYGPQPWPPGLRTPSPAAPGSPGRRGLPAAILWALCPQKGP